MQTFTGLEYLKIDIASNFGLDKMDWDQRIQWVDAHLDHLEDLVTMADTPALFFAGVQALRKTQAGEPTGYPISLDATASGLQLLACLAGCKASASLCGVVSTGHREDAYMVVYKAMCEAIGDTFKISRGDCKQAIMTSLYSSTAEPKRVFGEGALLETFYQTMQAMAPGAWNLNKSLQTLWQPMALSHDWIMPDNFHVHVKVTKTITQYVQFQNTPIPVTLKVNQGTKQGRSISPNIVHSVDALIDREMTRRCSYDPDKLGRLMEALLAHDPSDPKHEATRNMGAKYISEKAELVETLWQNYRESGFLSARILDCLNAKTLALVDVEVIKSLIATLPDKPFDILSIFDCFRCLPNYGNDLRRQYNHILSDIARSDMLCYIASQVTGHFIPVTKYGDISQDVLQADYALC